MIEALTLKAKATASHAAQTAAIGLVAVIAIIVGLGFLTLAGWLFLITITTALNAALILGSLFVGVGLLALVFATHRPSKHQKPAASHAAAAQPAGSMDDLVVAFLTGLSAGQKARS